MQQGHTQWLKHFLEHQDILDELSEQPLGKVVCPKEAIQYLLILHAYKKQIDAFLHDKTLIKVNAFFAKQKLPQEIRKSIGNFAGENLLTLDKFKERYYIQGVPKFGLFKEESVRIKNKQSRNKCKKI